MDHHATVVRSTTVATALVPVTKQSEVVEMYYERFGIDLARSLIHTAYQRPQHSARQQLVVRAEFVTLEAQNALLKVLEEPPESTEFVFVLPFDFQLLPTLASRFGQWLEVTDETEAKEFGDFLAATPAQRMMLIDVATKKKDHVWQQHIKTGLITYLRTNSGAVNRDLEFVARTLLTRGASNKMLLEQAALTLPLDQHR